jgi:predicted transposase/invertase (TIGR01784 family)
MFATHDKAYKALFSYPRMVKDLLQGFVHQGWVKSLDFKSLEKVNASYVSRDLRERHDDVVWKIKFKKKWLYIYILIEFQSTVDPFMAVRLLSYIALLYEDLIKSKKVRGRQKLPPILPIVLYNGERRWNAPTQLSGLVEKAPESLAKYTPQMEYLLIDEGAYANSQLAALKNVVAAIFRLEKDASPATLMNVSVCLVDWLKTPELAKLRQEIAGFLDRVYFEGKPYAEKFLLSASNPEEVRAMLAQQVEKMHKALIQKGIEKGEKLGIEKGEKLGIEKGVSTVAFRMLSDGFTLEIIARATGLSVEEIKKLQSKQ